MNPHKAAVPKKGKVKAHKLPSQLTGGNYQGKGNPNVIGKKISSYMDVSPKSAKVGKPPRKLA